MNRNQCMLWLSSIGAGHRSIKNLDHYFGDISYVMHAESKDLELCGIRSKRLKDAILAKDRQAFEKYLTLMDKHRIEYVVIHDNHYPEMLRQMPDPPMVLYYKGTLEYLSEKAMGMVGARKATPVGKHVARAIARDLGEAGVPVISGLAYGIDTEAHRGVVDSGGITVAVLGCGLDHTYPRGNAQLRDNILSLSGALVSEFPIGTAPLAAHFPQRNRIISGLSRGVIVVEAGFNSGSLITVDFALEQNRDVFSVPGSVLSSVSEGTNQLIKEGAIPVTEASDILKHYGDTTNTRKESLQFENLSDVERQICTWIKAHQPALADAVHLGTRISMEELLPCLTILEIKNIISKMGNQFMIKD